MLPTMRVTESTMLSRMGYDQQRQVLAVTFRKQDATYLYSDVPCRIWDALTRTRSVGRCMHAHVLGRFPCARFTQPEMVAADSQRYTSIGYDPVQQTLTLEVRGDLTRVIYRGVTSDQYRAFLLSPSREAYIDTQLHGTHRNSAYAPFRVPMQAVRSGLCVAYGYDAQKLHIYLRMTSGLLYRYPLSEQQWLDLRDAPALGAMLRAFIIPMKTGMVVS